MKFILQFKNYCLFSVCKWNEVFFGAENEMEFFISRLALCVICNNEMNWRAQEKPLDDTIFNEFSLLFCYFGVEYVSVCRKLHFSIQSHHTHTHAIFNLWYIRALNIAKVGTPFCGIIKFHRNGSNLWAQKATHSVAVRFKCQTRNQKIAMKMSNRCQQQSDKWQKFILFFSSVCECVCCACILIHP